MKLQIVDHSHDTIEQKRSNITTYLSKYAKKHSCSMLEASSHQLVRNVAIYYGFTQDEYEEYKKLLT